MSTRIPENLNDDRGAFNVDPTAATLEAGGETHQEYIPPAGRRNFVGGFVGGLKKAWGRNRNPPQGEDAVAFPEPAVVYDEEAQYESVPRAEPEMRYGSPSPGAGYVSPLQDARPSPGGQYTATPGVQYVTPAAQYPVTPAAQYTVTPSAQSATPFVQYAPVGSDAEYPEREPHRRHESSSSTSETVVHATQEQTYEGTTVVNHDILPGEIGSPEFVEPQPGSDYAKMSPPRSEASFGSYLTRIHRFLQMINDLPWVAQDRVTVDYIPGKARREEEGELALGPTARPRPGRRHAVISWYNSNAPQGSIDLLSSGSASGASPLPKFPQAKTPSTHYADDLPDNRGAPPPMMAAATRGMASQPQPQPHRPRRVPAPQYTPDPEPQPRPQHDEWYHSPRYPNGYVPYEQLDPAQMAHAYTGSSAASVLPPMHAHSPAASGAL
ncbi:hypothetical protein C8R47DRAFT_1079439 [Mycena vitilis]|nr:hypothetical protein C8R47DRAFT_1079439 [Mycena vitilis]